MEKRKIRHMIFVNIRLKIKSKECINRHYFIALLIAILISYLGVKLRERQNCDIKKSLK